MSNVFLLLGSNEGDRHRWIQFALEELQSSVGNITAQSPLYQTAAWGVEDQPDFLNMAVAVATRLSPTLLLENTQAIEHHLGRQRTEKWGQRTLDIDILFYDSDIIRLPQLVIPHPYVQDRRFALAPLEQVAPHFVHPVLKKTIRQLLLECPDPLPVTVVSG